MTTGQRSTHSVRALRSQLAAAGVPAERPRGEKCFTWRVGTWGDLELPLDDVAAPPSALAATRRLALEDVQAGERHPCNPGQTIWVGRASNWGPRPDVPCEGPHVSRRHLEALALPDGRLQLIDRSHHGTQLNGQTIERNLPMHAEVGDRLLLAQTYQLRVVDLDDPETWSETTTHLEEPSLIADRYRVLTEIGRGATGTVFRAYDELLDRPCALKLVPVHGGTTSKRAERFRREARFAARLGAHPSIVSVFDMGFVAEMGTLYCAMDLVEGSDLEGLIRKGIARREGVRIVAETARAVHHAHEQQVIHRDLKPANILVTADGTVQLTDFGLAKALDVESKLTAKNAALGTPHYMAPELLTSPREAGPASDIYALGVSLYYILTGKLPFAHATGTQAWLAIRQGDFARPRAVNPSIPETLEEICCQAFSPERDQRPETALALAEALEAWLEIDAPATPEAAPTPVETPTDETPTQPVGELPAEPEPEAATPAAATPAAATPEAARPAATTPEAARPAPAPEPAGQATPAPASHFLPRMIALVAAASVLLALGWMVAS